MAVLSSVASFAKRLAICRVVFPRHTSANVSFMVDLEHNVIERRRAQASGTAAAMQLDNILPKLNPIGVPIRFQLGSPASQRHSVTASQNIEWNTLLRA